MEKRNVPFCKPDITETEIELVVETLRSGWITTGPKARDFTYQIADRCGTTNAVVMNSQTACAEMTLRLLGVGPGDEVIVPAYTYTATASVVDHVGAKIVMIDCEKDHFNMDYDAVEAAINEHTKVIIPVDLFGIPADYDRIYEMVERKKHLFTPSDNKYQQAFGRIIVMDDGAHAFGATYHGKPVGSVADFTNFSFHAVKNLTTSEGGAITWKTIPGMKDTMIYERYMRLALHGQTKDAFAKTQLGAWEYDIVAPYFKCNMTDIHAAIGIGQLSRYDGMLARRKEIIETYDKGLSEINVKTEAHYTDKYQSSGHLYIMRVFNSKGEPISPEKRNAFIVKLAELGIAANVHYKPLPLHTGYQKMGFDIADYPNAYKQYQNEITLPLHTKLSDEDVEYVIWAVNKIYNEFID